MTPESNEEQLRERTKVWWRKTANLLPWSREGITGDGFATKLLPHLGSKKTLLEIGPGNGRILKAVQELGGRYASYTGLDIGVHKIAFLKQAFEDATHRFILCDAEKFVFEQRFDVVFSSATFKHLYPSFG
ncbi:unnamed protein product, partial [marine sediment metagenome]